MARVTAREAASDVAIEWFVRLRADDVTDAERAHFFDWLRVSRGHQHAFVEILRLWEGLAIVKAMTSAELRPFPVVWEYKRRVEGEGRA